MKLVFLFIYDKEEEKTGGGEEKEINTKGKKAVLKWKKNVSIF